MKKIVSSWILIIGISFFPSQIIAQCKPNDFIGVSIISKIDFDAMLPLRIANVPVATGHLPDPQGNLGSPICICPAPPPVFERMGITVSFFEPSLLIEVVRDAYCFPAMGFDMNITSLLKGTEGDGRDRYRTFYQSHFFYYPVYEILEMFIDSMCFDSSSFDLAYLTEVDPLWNSDSLSAIISPEALLFANPVTQLVCVIDSISSQFDVSLDPLFWCKGSWGSAYPMTGNTGTNNYVEDGASVAGSLIYKLHRQGMLWESGICGFYPAPIWRKSTYRLQLVTPIASPLATGIGKDGKFWASTKNIPFVAADNFAYLVFRKRKCCAS